MGSQQRSSAEFQQAIKLVRSKALGHIDKVYCRVGDPPKPFDLPEQPVPSNLNFNLWLGPFNNPKIHYNSDICPVVKLDPEEDEMADFLAKRGITYTVLFSERKLYQTYQVWAFPTLFFLDREGKIAKMHKGFGKGMEEELEADLVELLEK